MVVTKSFLVQRPCGTRYRSARADEALVCGCSCRC
ncbi:hypothetical protein PDIG_82600 [Penicillium digitatum PHI26]|uniref:Uncharacterized protein n=2 Tax=Penicillium digitatum TaxID=36651 RepID=K9FSA2_PEND2|nr:hypothetical protein PDIP_86400 [Penicillium digitatum Pd1]EKV04669.1 hypothetical protein PDIP_86400 [Penicillium digitatum Pd1]EKV05643.1 hypothetical protein PDIG_82600 [Penicillium digitatum PHI26]